MTKLLRLLLERLRVTMYKGEGSVQQYKDAFKEGQVVVVVGAYNQYHTVETLEDIEELRLKSQHMEYTKGIFSIPQDLWSELQIDLGMDYTDEGPPTRAH